MFEISVEYTFAAGHALRNYKGKCENVHGHNYKVRVTLAGEKLNGNGLLMDFVELRAELKRLVEKLDHHFLNDVDGLGPATLENLSAWIWCRLAPKFPNLWRVTVKRDSDTGACSFYGTAT